ncbi:MAG: adenylate/guanylate cyclase domain-containing protein [Rhizobiaceae bacterium]
MIDLKTIDDLIDWMIDGARPSANAREIVDAVCSMLVKAGVPVDRFSLFIYTLDPNLIGYRFAWTPDGGAVVSEGKLGLFSTPEYNANPLPHVIENRVSVRRKLCDPATPHDYKIVPELIADGFTDYFVQPIIYTTDETNAVSWSSKADGGFSYEALAVLERVNKPLARLTETYLLRINAATILSAYVGRNSGDQILSGKVHRGDGEEIEAAILFTDLVNFTAMSDALDGPQTVAILNDVFDLMVPPVADHGGEILKFMGDGFFAIFPYKGEEGRE